MRKAPNPSAEERRRFERIPAPQLSVSVRSYNSNTSWREAEVKDFTRLGVGLLVDDTDLGVGDTVLLKVTLGPDKPKLFDFRVTGTIRNHAFEDGKHRLGVEFVGAGIFSRVPVAKLGRLEGLLDRHRTAALKKADIPA